MNYCSLKVSEVTGETVWFHLLCRMSMKITWWHYCHSIWQAEDKPVWFLQLQVYHSLFSSITMERDITAHPSDSYNLSEIHLWWLAYCHGNYNRLTEGCPWHILWHVLTRHDIATREQIYLYLVNIFFSHLEITIAWFTCPRWNLTYRCISREPSAAGTQTGVFTMHSIVFFIGRRNWLLQSSRLLTKSMTFCSCRAISHALHGSVNQTVSVLPFGCRAYTLW